MTLTHALTTETPVGALTLTEEAGAITHVAWGAGGIDRTPLLLAASAQLAEYFAGRRTAFDLPLAPRGSEVLLAFLTALRAIPPGETRTYGELARPLGITAQEAGQLCGANPIPLLIPCHRVLAADGLGGYSGAGGIETKVALLKLEGAAGLLI